MCGRFTHPIIDWSEFLEYFPDLRIDSEIGEQWDIAPTMAISVLLHDGRSPAVRAARWGLIPSWCDDVRFGNKTFNARGETVAAKPSFRDSFKNRRCLIPAGGYYEWKRQVAGGTLPYRIQLRGAALFAFAGLWATNTRCGPDEILSATIITCEANRLCADVHHRMPVILRRCDYGTWLEPNNTDTAALQRLLLPYPAEEMELIPGRRPEVPSDDLFES